MLGKFAYYDEVLHFKRHFVYGKREKSLASDRQLFLGKRLLHK